MRRATTWLAENVDVRDLHFYGGLLLFALGGGRWAIVGAVLALHGLLPSLAALRKGA